MANEPNPTPPGDDGDDGTRVLPPYNTDDYQAASPARAEQPPAPPPGTPAWEPAGSQPLGAPAPGAPAWEPPSYAPPAEHSTPPPAGSYAPPQAGPASTPSYGPPSGYGQETGYGQGSASGYGQRAGYGQGTVPGQAAPSAIPPYVPGASAYPSGGPSYPTSAPSASSPPPFPASQQSGHQGQAPYGYQPGGYGAPRAPRAIDDSAVKALLDFGFTQYATPGLVKLVYILTVVAGVGSWLLTVLTAFAADSFVGGGAGSGIVALLFGWIPAALFVALMRFTLEFFLVNIRTNAKLTELVDRLGEQDAAE